MDRLLLDTSKPAELGEIRKLRQLLNRMLKAAIPSESLRNRILLCFSEAATNLVEHGNSQRSELVLRLGRDANRWWLELLDNGPAWDPTKAAEAVDIKQLDLEERGRGLALLHTLCNQIEYTPGEDSYNSLRLSWEIKGQSNRPTLLVVEDDASLRRLYSAYLLENFEVISVLDGEEALEILANEKIDLVLSDIRMPKMGGLRLREILQERDAHNTIPFIFLTSANDPEVQSYASGLGIDDFLVKPVSKVKLINTITRVLGRSQQVHNKVADRLNLSITSSLAPSIPESANGWRMRVMNRHTGIGGGDMLLYQQDDNQLTFALVDIMGHDDSAKFFAYAYGGYIRGLMQALTPLTPDDLLQRLSKSAHQDSLLSQVTLTCCIATLHEGGLLTVACAGHPAPWRIKSSGAEVINVGGMLPGLLESTTYHAETIRIPRGERVAFYTDGLVESAPDHDARKALEIQIRKTLVKTLKDPIDDAISDTMSSFDAFTDQPAKDDALLLLIEPASTPVSTEAE